LLQNNIFECYDLTLYFCINLLFGSVNAMYVFVTCPYAGKSYTLR